jgi:hypothetical protein
VKASVQTRGGCAFASYRRSRRSEGRSGLVRKRCRKHITGQILAVDGGLTAVLPSALPQLVRDHGIAGVFVEHLRPLLIAIAEAMVPETAATPALSSVKTDIDQFAE